MVQHKIKINDHKALRIKKSKFIWIEIHPKTFRNVEKKHLDNSCLRYAIKKTCSINFVTEIFNYFRPCSLLLEKKSTKFCPRIFEFRICYQGQFSWNDGFCCPFMDTLLYSSEICLLSYFDRGRLIAEICRWPFPCDHPNSNWWMIDKNEIEWEFA